MKLMKFFKSEKARFSEKHRKKANKVQIFRRNES